jgi:hypothetical protein
MTSTKITPKTLIELRAKNPELGSILTLDIKDTKKNKDTTFPTYYIPVRLINSDGARVKCKLTIVKQIVASNAKPFGKDEKATKAANDVFISFRKFFDEDLNVTDYPDNEKPTLLKQNEELIEALKILSEEYMYLVNNVVVPYDGDKFEIQDPDTLKIANFVQTERKATDEEKKEDAKRGANEKLISKSKKIALANPIYRIKINGDKDTKRIGRINYKTKKVEYTVFDVRKPSKESGKKYMPAKLKDGSGKLVDLTVSNIKHFLTYMSLIGGIIEFEDVCVSKSGISLKTRFQEIYVMPHKPLKPESMNQEDLDEMASAVSTGNTDDMVITDEPEPEDEDDVQETKSKPKSKSSSNKQSVPVRTGRKPVVQEEPEEQELTDEPMENEEEDNPDDPDNVKADDTTSGNDNNDNDDNDDNNDDGDGSPKKASSPPKITNKTKDVKPATKPASKPAAKPKAPAKPATKKAVKSDE